MASAEFSYRDASITSQVALKAAADVSPEGSPPEHVIETAKQFMRWLTAAADYETKRLEGLRGGVAAAPTAQTLTPQQATANVAAGLGGQVVSGHTVADAWQALLANPKLFYDNRNEAESSFNGGRKPDFRAKKNAGIVDEKGQPRALWLYSEFPGGEPPPEVLAKYGRPVQQAPAPQPQVAPVMAAAQAAVQDFGPDEAPF